MSILQSLSFCDGESELPHLMTLTASIRYVMTTFYIVYLKAMIRCILSGSCIKEIERDDDVRVKPPAPSVLHPPYFYPSFP